MLGLIRRTLQPQLAFLHATRASSYLGHLNPAEGATKSYKRLGRGPASGKGKTSGRGQKGQKARGKVPFWLEGGQTPYYKRFPIIGFKRPHRAEYNELNLGRIQEFWNHGRIPLKEGDTLTIRVMKECGLITGMLRDGVKILSNGAETYKVPLNVEASQASEKSIQTIEKLGNTFSARYFTKLSLRAHVDPDWFLLKRGHVPLPARPTHRRIVNYYSNEEKRGYLLKERSLLLEHVGETRTRQKKSRKSAIAQSLETALDKKYSDYDQCGVVDIASV